MWMPEGFSNCRKRIKTFMATWDVGLPRKVSSTRSGHGELYLSRVWIKYAYQGKLMTKQEAQKAWDPVDIIIITPKDISVRCMYATSCIHTTRLLPVNPGNLWCHGVWMSL